MNIVTEKTYVLELDEDEMLNLVNSLEWILEDTENSETLEMFLDKSSIMFLDDFLLKFKCNERSV